MLTGYTDIITKKHIYRCDFYFTVKRKDYSVNYFKANAEDKFFTENIYQLPQGQCIFRRMIDYEIPTAGQALEILTLIIEPKID
jgi:hypothetical protein